MNAHAYSMEVVAQPARLGLTPYSASSPARATSLGDGKARTAKPIHLFG